MPAHIATLGQVISSSTSAPEQISIEKLWSREPLLHCFAMHL